MCQLTGDAESKFKVFVMVREVIFLHLTHIIREHGMVQTVNDEFKLSFHFQVEKDIRVMHAIVEHVYIIVELTVCQDLSVYSQNVKAPAIIPFATAAGKRMCAKRVKGACNMMKRTGGMTSLNLENVRYRRRTKVFYPYRSIGR